MIIRTGRTSIHYTNSHQSQEQELDDKKFLVHYVTLCQSALGDITRQGFRVTLGLIFWMSPLKPCDICIISPAES